MALTDEEGTAVEAWLQQHPRYRVCPECQGDTVASGRHVLMWVDEAGNARQGITTPGERLIALRCRQCGYVRLFGAEAVGLPP